MKNKNNNKVNKTQEEKDDGIIQEIKNFAENNKIFNIECKENTLIIDVS